MTAEEILDNKESFDFLKGAKRRRVIIAMEKFAKEMCKKQRIRCAVEYDNHPLDELNCYYTIKNAPLPTPLTENDATL